MGAHGYQAGWRGICRGRVELVGMGMGTGMVEAWVHMDIRQGGGVSVGVGWG